MNLSSRSTLAMTAMLALLPAGKASAAPLFPSRLDFPTGRAAFSIAVADLNNDGRPDVAAAANNINSASIHLGDGAGNLLPFTNYPAGPTPQEISVGDFDRDGLPDLVISNIDDTFSNKFSYLRGAGAGSFPTRTEFATGTYPRGLAPGDFNRDANPDLALACELSNGAAIHPGNGLGSFGGPTIAAAASGPSHLEVADMNGDGAADVAVAAFSADAVSVLLNNGAGGFLPRTDYAVGDSPYAVAIGDVNNDSSPDLATANWASHNVSVRFNDGTGHFLPGATLSGGFGSRFVAIADLDSDGDGDVVVANYWSGTVTFYLGNGDGTFDAGTSLAVQAGPSCVRAADMNGDGCPDLIVSNSSANTISVFLNACEEPVPVRILAFSARAEAGRMLIHWEVGEDLSGATFDVYRRSAGDAEKSLLEEGLSGRRSYDVVDESPGTGSGEYWLRAIERGGAISWYGPYAFDAPGAARPFSLAPGRPNPFRTSVSLNYVLDRESRVRLDVYDAAGRRVVRLVDGLTPAGSHNRAWDGRDDQGLRVSPGAYFIRLETDGDAATSKVTVIP